MKFFAGHMKKALDEAAQEEVYIFLSKLYINPAPEILFRLRVYIFFLQVYRNLLPSKRFRSLVYIFQE